MIRRIYIVTAVLTVIGVAGAAWYGGRTAAIGFLMGAAYSVLSFRFLHRAAESLGTDKPNRASAVFFALRFLLLGLLLYVIMRTSESSLPAALCGLFVAFAAAIWESIYQLYARTS